MCVCVCMCVRAAQTAAEQARAQDLEELQVRWRMHAMAMATDAQWARRAHNNHLETTQHNTRPHPGRQASRQAGWQAGWQAGKQAGWQAGKQAG